ncbi:MAG: hypothetical protein VYC71_03640 [Planctomycetota bacterium]|nr:hypothetical protein [Planctomycetota bacterium]
MFQTVTAKLGNMRKAVEWTVCPAQQGREHRRIIQSKNRIAEVNLDRGSVVLSDGKGGHQGFYKLDPFLGATVVDCPPELLEQLRGMDATTGPVRIV